MLDKTGTLTVGKPMVVLIEPIETYNEKELLTLIASIEIGSEHPIGKAIVDYALSRNVPLYEIKDFQTIPGKGVRGTIQNRNIIVGNSRFIKQEGVNIDQISDYTKELEDQGLTIVIVAENSKYIGLIAVGDKLKEDAVETIELLYSAGFDLIMITGDNWRVANAIAKKLEIKEVFAEVLPQEKSEEIRKLQSKGFKVAMVGDGINDAPALMQADIGIAIGAGVDIAIESADIILVGDTLKSILEAYNISKSSYSKTVQNIVLAFSFNAIGVVAAIAGIVHPIWAMIAMALSVTTILLNSFGGKYLLGSYNVKDNDTTHQHQVKP